MFILELLYLSFWLDNHSLHLSSLVTCHSPTLMAHTTKASLHTAAHTGSGKAKGGTKKKATRGESDGKASSSKHLVISWGDEHTDHMLNWLDQNPLDWARLFSDSIGATKAEGCKTTKAKGSKATFHMAITKVVFSLPFKPTTVHASYTTNMKKYANSVAKCLTWLVFIFHLQYLAQSDTLLAVSRNSIRSSTRRSVRWALVSTTLISALGLLFTTLLVWSPPNLSTLLLTPHFIRKTSDWFSTLGMTPWLLVHYPLLQPHNIHFRAWSRSQRWSHLAPDKWGWFWAWQACRAGMQGGWRWSQC